MLHNNQIGRIRHVTESPLKYKSNQAKFSSAYDGGRQIQN